MNRILCPTGAVIGRPNGRDFTLLNKFREQLECDGYEFLMYDTTNPKALIIKAFGCFFLCRNGGTRLFCVNILCELVFTNSDNYDIIFTATVSDLILYKIYGG